MTPTMVQGSPAGFWDASVIHANRTARRCTPWTGPYGNLEDVTGFAKQWRKWHEV